MSTPIDCIPQFTVHHMHRFGWDEVRFWFGFSFFFHFIVSPSHFISVNWLFFIWPIALLSRNCWLLNLIMLIPLFKIACRAEFLSVDCVVLCCFCLGDLLYAATSAYKITNKYEIDNDRQRLKKESDRKEKVQYAAGEHSTCTRINQYMTCFARCVSFRFFHIASAPVMWFVYVFVCVFFFLSLFHLISQFSAATASHFKFKYFSFYDSLLPMIIIVVFCSISTECEKIHRAQVYFACFAQ